MTCPVATEPEPFNLWLAQELKRRRWTPAQLARYCQMGTVADILAGRRAPTYVLQVRLARALALPLAAVQARAQVASQLLPLAAPKPRKLVDLLDAYEDAASHTGVYHA